MLSLSSYFNGFGLGQNLYPGKEEPVNPVRLGLVLLVAMFGAGCGPVQSMTVIWEASSALEAAEATDAQKQAPYELVAAQAYLDKALEEQAYADFESAIEFGTKARDMARKATDKALAARRQAPPPSMPPPSDSPAAMAPVGNSGGRPIIVPVNP